MMARAAKFASGQAGLRARGAIVMGIRRPHIFALSLSFSLETSGLARARSESLGPPQTLRRAGQGQAVEVSPAAQVRWGPGQFRGRAIGSQPTGAVRTADWAAYSLRAAHAAD